MKIAFIEFIFILLADKDCSICLALLPISIKTPLFSVPTKVELPLLELNNGHIRDKKLPPISIKNL